MLGRCPNHKKLCLLINVTLVVKIQESFSRTLGFALPCLFMCTVAVFNFAGTKVYAYVEDSSSFSCS